MKRGLIKICILIISSVIVLFIIVYWLQEQEFKNYQKRGTLLIDQIETFKKTKKRLPDNFQELELKEPMNEGPYYEKQDSINYTVFFCVGFDNTIIYYSDKKKWIYERNL